MSSKLREELKDKEYRDAFVAAYVRNGIAFQIRAMRDSRGWDQKKLAEKMGNAKLQPIISRYENPDYGRFSMTTLLDLAKAFDVGLIVKFAPFSELIERDEDFADESLNVENYAKEVLSDSVLPKVSQPIVMPDWIHVFHTTEPIAVQNFVKPAAYMVTQSASAPYHPQYQGQIGVSIVNLLPTAINESLQSQSISRYEVGE